VTAPTEPTDPPEADPSGAEGTEPWHRERRRPSALDDQHLLSDPDAVELSRRPGPIQRIANIWRYRELLRNLARTQLKVKYKNSVLGFLWSLLNPVLYLVVFTIVFDKILGSGIEDFPIYLLSGLLAWNLFSTSLGDATGSIVGNAALVSRVWFPREILPLAAIGAAVVHFFLQLLVLLGALVVFQHSPGWEYAPLLPVAMVVLLLVAASIGILLSAVNVYLRDTAHFLELALLAWFWMTPIVYKYTLVSDKLGGKSGLMLLNPMIPITSAIQRFIYNPADSDLTLPIDVGIGWYLRNLAIVGGSATVLMLIALTVFGRLEDNFAEEI
jgi:ABC-2 type transport system permease protein